MSLSTLFPSFNFSFFIKTPSGNDLKIIHNDYLRMTDIYKMQWFSLKGRIK